MTHQSDKQQSRGVSTDMSPAEITRRLRIVGELYRANKIRSGAKLVMREESPLYKVSDLDIATTPDTKEN